MCVSSRGNTRCSPQSVVTCAVYSWMYSTVECCVMGSSEGMECAWIRLANPVEEQAYLYKAAGPVIGRGSRNALERVEHLRSEKM